ncbi:hypothetical protein GCM10008014_28010 [Paenibacillus silvae]|uniref:Uncharacterized protein n=1 Tax=Paenibacillus silvae TaxID=1325358 RepID=A0ABQ1ZC39_9BACL|nr:hypothetical protein GCM10008014_28010 [Paenibacillus silvae]
MANLMPMHEILAVKNGYAGKIFKRAGHQIVVILDPAYARIRVESRNNRI